MTSALTPALSPRRGGTRAAFFHDWIVFDLRVAGHEHEESGERARTVRVFKVRRGRSPSPGGEGRGEGGHSPKPFPAQAARST